MSRTSLPDALKKMQDIDKVISTLDPAIKVQAFEFLCRHYFEADQQTKDLRVDSSDASTQLPSDADEFFTSFSHDHPSDNVLLVAAWLYGQHGTFPITKKLVAHIANQARLTIPDRPDKMMSAARYDGKKLFAKREKGFQLTVHGETYLKKTYSVRKGNTPLPKEPTE